MGWLLTRRDRMSTASWVVTCLFYYGSFGWLLYYDWKIAIAVHLMCGSVYACRRAK